MVSHNSISELNQALRLAYDALRSTDSTWVWEHLQKVSAASSSTRYSESNSNVRVVIPHEAYTALMQIFFAPVIFTWMRKEGLLPDIHNPENDVLFSTNYHADQEQPGEREGEEIRFFYFSVNDQGLIKKLVVYIPHRHGQFDLLPYPWVEEVYQQ